MPVDARMPASGIPIAPSGPSTAVVMGKLEVNVIF
jgi:hypothetical protein